MFVKRLVKPKTLIASSDGRQFRSGYVVLRKGEEVGEHSTKSGEEILVILKGISKITVNGKSKKVSAASVVLIPPYTIHNVKNASAVPLKYVYIVSEAK